MQFDIEKKPKFLDYRLTDIRRTGVNDDGLEEGDYVIDRYGIMGEVKFKSSWGNYIEFIDGFTVYDSVIDLGIKKSYIINPGIYQRTKYMFKDITKIARIMLYTLQDDFNFINLFNNGKSIFLRASSASYSVMNYSTQQITGNVDFLSMKFDPLWNIELETFAIKKNKRNTKWAKLLLRDLFIDLDLDASSEMRRVDINITDRHEYNEELFKELKDRWRKFDIKIL